MTYRGAGRRLLGHEYLPGALDLGELLRCLPLGDPSGPGTSGRRLTIVAGRGQPASLGTNPRNGRTSEPPADSSSEPETRAA